MALSITERRELRGWTQFDLAAAAGVSPDTVRRAERGEPTRLLQLIEQALAESQPIAHPKKRKRLSITTGRPRGFGTMDSEKQREIASQGGKAAHAMGRSHQFTPEEAREAGKRGACRNKRRMRELGHLGGQRRAAQFREQAAQRAQELQRGPLPAVSALPAPSEEEWDPGLEELGSPITGGNS